MVVSYKIFVSPPTLNDLRLRLEARKTDTREVIQQRLETAAEEIKLANQLNIFNKMIINKDKESFLSEVKEILENWYPFIKH